MNEWIPSKDEQPPILTEVLISWRHIPQFALFYSDGGGNTRDGEAIDLRHIQWWAHILPAPEDTYISAPVLGKPATRISLHTASGQRSRKKTT